MPHSVHDDSSETSLLNINVDESNAPSNPVIPASTAPPDDQVITLNDQLLQWMRWSPISEYDGHSRFPPHYGLSCWSNQCPTPQTSIDMTGYFAGPFSRGLVSHTPFIHEWCHRRIYPSRPASPRDNAPAVSHDGSLVNGIDRLRVEEAESDNDSEGAEGAIQVMSGGSMDDASRGDSSN
jgi:hypothetical protein